MAHFPLIDDATPPDLAAALLAGDDARRRREAEVEVVQRGRFVPLDL